MLKNFINPLSPNIIPENGSSQFFRINYEFKTFIPEYLMTRFRML